MWEWSFSDEGLQNIRENIRGLERDKLEVIYAEWKAKKKDGELSEYKYDIALKQSKRLPSDILADYIWKRAEQQADCENGGWNAYVCPFHCGCHTVSLDKEKILEDKFDRTLNQW